MDILKYFLLILIGCLFISCSETSQNSITNEPTLSKEIQGLNKVEIGQYYGFQSKLKYDPTSKLCVSYRFEFKMNSLLDIEDFSLHAFYFDVNCKVTLFDLDFIGNGHFVNNETKLLDSTIKYALMTPFYDQIADAFNMNNSCGVNTWSTNQRIDILNTSCARSSKGRLYFSKIDDDLTIYNCDENEELSAKCTKIEMHPTH